ncbi:MULTISPECIES: N-acetylglucosamine-6-phosphate deacetylase [unclassified Paenibacillus]|uniref:N-acetylglucosamine-6-phosphate deacetylase n=1 Tax=unclassified Paenibacillus TaxID=185978 RepID=UPI000CFACD2F|nr:MULTISPECIES: N-acetylglucosamine-6-phosphate deacetylase [unclassified Paenibacillus]PRA02099.1 N-acetylglucosamine-6-phosphate deacetylase [Paenibacillus sp. MYb63]PRA44976.1 N-acetylglucosamine-6-phosphate deacetylase [Paenibacillus sp. MYb67]
MSGENSHEPGSRRDESISLLRGRLLLADEILEDGVLAWRNGKILYAGVPEGLPERIRSEALPLSVPERGLIVPGFIDIHVHGGNGEDFMDSSPEVLDKITSFHSTQGTTAMLATSMSAPKERLDSVLAEVDRYRSGEMPYAQLEGVHLEGPFFSPKWPGAQNPEHIILPDVTWLEAWEKQYPGLIRQVTLAPERQGALEVISWLREQRITAALGHTDATYEEVERAVEAGLHHAVHTFNAMTPLHHRLPGAAGAVLSDPRISAEVIADGIHVHPAAISILAQLKQHSDQLVLITDAMSAAGLDDGEYKIGDLPVIVKHGEARLKDGGALAGSTLTMIRGFRYLVQEVGLSLNAASRAASLTPARLLGIDHRTGSLVQGKQADIVLLNAELDIEGVWVKGRRVGESY